MSEQDSPWDPRTECAALTDIGMRRSNNQDSHSVLLARSHREWIERGHFFMVADGMGAHAAGELASKLAVDGVAHLYHKYFELSPPEALEKALVETNAEVHRRGQANTDFRNMGTTASVLVLLPQGALVAHIGDSRVYRLHDRAIQQLTFDHSLVWELKRAGQFSEQSDLAQAIPKNVITRSLGPNASVQVDIEGPFPTRVGDVFLVCSDGLTGKLEDREVAAILSQLPPQQAAQLLIDLANLRGGPDNITVLVARVAGPEVASDSSGDEPLRVGRSDRASGGLPLMWVALAVCLSIALVLALTDRPWAALGLAAAGGMLVGATLLVRGLARGKGEFLTADRRLGRGPYSETPCPTAEEAADLLERLTQEVRRQDAAGKSAIDWAQFDEACRTASQARSRGRVAESIRSRAEAVRALMMELREEAGDSAIDY